MIEVTKEQFYSTIGQLDVVTRPERDKTYWELRDRTLVGVTTPGYMMEDVNGNYTTERKYFKVKA